MWENMTFGWNTYRNNQHTHEHITKKALLTLQHSNQNKEKHLTSRDVFLISTYAEQPDYDEKVFVNDNHFYSMRTGKSYLNQDDTALSRFLSHTQRALNFCKEGNKDQGFRELGRACHFLEEFGQPNHVTTDTMKDAITTFKTHLQFEDYAGKYQDRILQLLTITLKKNKDEDFEDDIKAMALSLGKKSMNYEKEVKAIHNTEWYKVSRNCLHNTTQTVTDFLNRFLEEINS